MRLDNIKENRSREISVPLMPARDTDLSYPVEVHQPAIGKLTVRTDPSKPGLLRMENPIALETEAEIDSIVMAALSFMTGIDILPGISARVEIDEKRITRPCIDSRRRPKLSELPGWFDAELLELPILAGALEAMGVMTSVLEDCMCFGALHCKVARETHLGTTVDIPMEEWPRTVGHGDQKTISYMARRCGLIPYSPDSAENLLVFKSEGTDCVDDSVLRGIEVEVATVLAKAVGKIFTGPRENHFVALAEELEKDGIEMLLDEVGDDLEFRRGTVSITGSQVGMPMRDLAELSILNGRPADKDAVEDVIEGIRTMAAKRLPYKPETE